MLTYLGAFYFVASSILTSPNPAAAITPLLRRGWGRLKFKEKHYFIFQRQNEMRPLIFVEVLIK